MREFFRMPVFASRISSCVDTQANVFLLFFKQIARTKRASVFFTSLGVCSFRLLLFPTNIPMLIKQYTVDFSVRLPRHYRNCTTPTNNQATADISGRTTVSPCSKRLPWTASQILPKGKGNPGQAASWWSCSTQLMYLIYWHYLSTSYAHFCHDIMIDK